MSDDITDTHADTAEPSMEDILASIRRIIADDDVSDGSLAVDSGADFLSVVEDDVVSEVVDTADIETAEVVSSEPVETATELSVADEALEGLSIENADLELSDLELDEIMEPLELDVETELAGIEELDDHSDESSIGLTSMAAGLGGVAAAGAATAKKLKDTRANPVPSLADEDDALDLLLDDVSLHEEGGLESLLEIPDSEESAPIDDIEVMLGDVLPESDDIVAEAVDISEEISSDDSVFDPAAELLAEDADISEHDLTDNMISDMLGNDDEDIAASSQTDEDLDLVKSLMADLTDDPYADFDDEESDFAEEGESSDNEADLVDDILSLSMDDEVSLQQDADNSAIEAMLGDDADAEVLDDSDLADILAADADSDEPVLEHADPFIISMSEDLSARPAPAAERSRLSAIADMAMEDADRIERSAGTATAFAAGAGVMIATAGPLAATVGASQGDEVQEPLSASHEPNLQEAEDIFEGIKPNAGEASQAAELETPDTEIHETQTISPTEETADMPKAAANKDTIIDVVTEEASASAFASLNSVVEEKAIMADRGDRIGDLVQEALRPMLKEWLDKNLKGIVERAVTKEVKRISSGK